MYVMYQTGNTLNIAKAMILSSLSLRIEVLAAMKTKLSVVDSSIA